MLTSVRPRPAPGWQPFRPLRQEPQARGALIERVHGGPSLQQAETLLDEFRRQFAALFADVPGLSEQVLADARWQDASGQPVSGLLPPAGCLLLARRGPQAIGMVAVMPLAGRPGCAELKRLYVRRGFRGEGIARSLLQRAVGEACRFGYRDLLLETSPRMPDAVSLYRRAGFQSVPAYRSRPATLDRHFLSLQLALSR